MLLNMVITKKQIYIYIEKPSLKKSASQNQLISLTPGIILLFIAAFEYFLKAKLKVYVKVNPREITVYLGQIRFR